MRCLIAAFMIGFIVTGCVSSSRPMDSQVVERSKRQPPAWVEWQPNQIHEDRDAYSFVSLKSQIIDLPLGVKQTQLSAQAASRNALHELLRKELYNQAASQAVQIQSVQELDDKIMLSVEKLQSEYSNIKDIYFEKINTSLNADIKSDYFYNVYVLIQFDVEKIPLVLKDLTKSLKKSPESDLVALSKIIRPQFRSH